MVVWSAIGRNVTRSAALVSKNTILLQNFKPEKQLRRWGGHGHSFEVKESSWMWDKMRDMIIYYTFVGVTPYALIALYCNIFIGPATLEEIPEDYNPQHWEYYQHPISRFIQRYFYQSDQEMYEKQISYLYKEDTSVKMERIDNRVEELIKKRKDYRAFYYRPITANYIRVAKEYTDDTMEVASGYSYNEVAEMERTGIDKPIH